MPEEVAVAIIAHALERYRRGALDLDSDRWPVVQIHRFRTKPRVDGISAGAAIEVSFAVTLRTEFVPVAKEEGPIKNLYFKVFPKGTCQVPGVVIGFPVLDVEPKGLGWEVQPSVHVFRGLDVSLRCLG